MKMLYSDKVIAKLRKIPTFVWYLFLAISYFFANAYTYTAGGRSIIDSLVSAYEQAGLAINSKGLIALIAIVSPIIDVLLFEIIMKVAYNSIDRRFMINGYLNYTDMAFRVRLTVIVANLIIGVVGIAYFFYQPMIGITGAVIPFSAYTLLVWLCYEDMRVRFLPNRLHAKIFSFIARWYLGIYAVISAYSFISTIIYSSSSTLDIVATAVDFGIKLLFVGLAYWRYTKLKDIEITDDDHKGDGGKTTITIEIPKDIFGQFGKDKDSENKPSDDPFGELFGKGKDGGDDNNIFKDLNF